MSQKYDSINGESFLTKIVNLIDLYSIPINFTYNKRKYFPTLCGALISLLILIILGLYLAYNISSIYPIRYYTQKEYNFIRDESPPIKVLKDKSYDNLKLTKDNITTSDGKNTTYFYFSVGLMNSENQFINLDPTYFRLNVSNVKLINDQLIYTSLNYYLCPKFGDDTGTNNSILFNQTYCINDNYLLIGTYNRNNSSWIEIVLTYCQGKSECKSIDEITSYASKLKFEVLYEDNTYIPKNLINFPDNTINKMIKLGYWNLVGNFTFIGSFKLSISELRFYSNFILPRFLQFESFKSFFALEINNYPDYFKDINNNFELVKIIFESNQENKIITIEFEDFLSEFINIGAISGILYLIGGALVNHENYFKKTENLINRSLTIIPPANQKNIDTSFENFISHHYNKLALEYYNTKNIIPPISIEMVQIEDLKSIEGKPEENLFEKNKDDSNKVLNIEEHSQAKESILKSQKTNVDDYKIVSDAQEVHFIGKDFTLLEKYFTLERIESIYDVTEDERKKYLINLRNSEQNINSDYNFFQKIFESKKKNNMFFVESIVYDVFKFYLYNPIERNLFKRMSYYICCKCSRKKKIDNSQIKIEGTLDPGNSKNDYEKTVDIFNVSSEYINEIFDLTTITDNIDNYYKLTELFFKSSACKGLVNQDVHSKITLSDNDNESITASSSNEEKIFKKLLKFRKVVAKYIEEKNFKKVDYVFLENSGIQKTKLDEFERYIQESKYKIDEEKLAKINPYVNKELFDSKNIIDLVNTKFKK